MKFADKYFEEIKPGAILINVDDSDDEFTRGTEYKVCQDGQRELFVVDDCGYEEIFNRVLAKYFVIKEPNATEPQKHKQAESANDKYAYLQAVAEDLLQWLKENGLSGSGHARCLEQALVELENQEK
ncbi:MAG TPA: hypothetical protein DDZ91_12145 [Firmicutes bacterium]|jgi:hypothetical protein|nr:hypothetical protein [Bacillota bacterium]